MTSISFFFQAEDGIRDYKVTGVQTCALPIYLFVANYIDLDLKTAPVPESGPCLYKGVMVACGPPGLRGDTNILYHNNGDGTFKDVTQAAGIRDTLGSFGLGVLTADFDNDGWPDI